MKVPGPAFAHHFPPARRLFFLACLLLLAPLRALLVTAGVEHEGDNEEDQPEGDVRRRAERVLRRVDGARIFQREDDDQAEGDAGHVGAQQVAEQ